MKIFVWSIFSFFSIMVCAQNKKEIKVIDVFNNGVANANVYLCNKGDTLLIATTNTNGVAVLANKIAVLKVSAIGYKSLVTSNNVIILSSIQYQLDAVAIKAVRLSNNAAGTFSNMSGAEIKKLNIGQDLPFMLNNLPNVVTTSDAGAGVGYTGMRIRGSDVTRINFTVNGVALNDAESHSTFFVNMPDFISSIDNIQVQRGVGTSTQGASSFGANVSMQTSLLSPSFYAELNNGIGSFNTLKNTVKVGSGFIGKSNIAVDARLSSIASDGYIDRGASNLKGYFVQAGYYGSKTSLKLLAFGGKEKTYQSWNGIPQDSLLTNRKLNLFTYENQTDNYTQLHYQAILTQVLNKNMHCNITFHRTDGKGYYEEFKDKASLDSYGLQPIILGTDSFSDATLVRQKWLDNSLNGIITNWIYSKNKFYLQAGASYNTYNGKHFHQIVSDEYKAIPSNYIYYNTTSLKSDLNVFAKITYDLTTSLKLFSEMQYRLVNYSFLGFETPTIQAQQKVRLPFYNPKVGASYVLNDANFVYVTYGIANKEPNRDDFVNSTKISRAQAEQLRDLEIGYKYQTKKILAELVFFNMNYENQLIANGSINDVGAYNRINVPNSFRRGIEIIFNYNLNNKIAILSNVSFSKNKIKQFKEYVFNYDTFTDSIFTYNNTDISFSPGIVGAASIVVKPFKNFNIEWQHKYVGKQYLDNSQSANRLIKYFYVSNILLNYDLLKLWKIKKVNLSLAINNLFNKLYESNGYTYGDIANNTRNSYNYYYPQATTNYMFNVNITF